MAKPEKSPRSIPTVSYTHLDVYKRQMVYLGAESGSDKVLKDICKGETRQQLIDGVRKIEACGMKASVTFISGLAGRDGWEDHAIQTGTMISEMEPVLSLIHI